MSKYVIQINVDDPESIGSGGSPIRDRFGPYDAFNAIVALLSEATLLRTDRGLARAAEGYCMVEYVATS